jgi:hypothetical protein
MYERRRFNNIRDIANHSALPTQAFHSRAVKYTTTNRCIGLPKAKDDPIIRQKIEVPTLAESIHLSHRFYWYRTLSGRIEERACIWTLSIAPRLRRNDICAAFSRSSSSFFLVLHRDSGRGLSYHPGPWCRLSSRPLACHKRIASLRGNLGVLGLPKEEAG